MGRVVQPEDVSLNVVAGSVMLTGQLKIPLDDYLLLQSYSIME
jgi:hypothetical protein